jgi:hypothetical protein
VDRDRRRDTNCVLLWMHSTVISEIVNRSRVTSAA